MSRALIGLAAIVGLLGLLLASLVGGATGADWSADRRARSFCGSIAIGSDIVPAIARFEAGEGHYDSMKSGKANPMHDGDDTLHDFRFAGFMFSSTRCRVDLNTHGQVTAKSTYWDEL